MFKPIAAAIQMLAAVVKPCAELPRRTIAPAPKNPMPTTTYDGMRVSPKCAPIAVNAADAVATSRCVRKPAGLAAACRCTPTAPPRMAAPAIPMSGENANAMRLRLVCLGLFDHREQFGSIEIANVPALPPQRLHAFEFRNRSRCNFLHCARRCGYLRLCHGRKRLQCGMQLAFGRGIRQQRGCHARNDR